MPHECAPAFQFYPKDYLSDRRVRAMTAEARGVYLHLLCYCWIDGHIPDPETGACWSELAVLADTPVAVVERVWPELQACFQPDGAGGLRQPRIEREREKQQLFRRAGRAGGVAAARARVPRLTATDPRLVNQSDPVVVSQAVSPVHPRVLPQCVSPVGQMVPPQADSDVRTGVMASSLLVSSDLISSQIPSVPQKQVQRDPQQDVAGPPIPVHLKDLWNAEVHAPIPKAQALSPRRTAHCRARLKERPLEAWVPIFRRIARSAFCQGQNKTGWRASFDWVIRSPDVALRVLEGIYDDRQPALTTHQPASSSTQAEQRRNRDDMRATEEREAAISVYFAGLPADQRAEIEAEVRQDLLVRYPAFTPAQADVERGMRLLIDRQHRGHPLPGGLVKKETGS